MELPNLTNAEWFQEMIRELELSSEVLMGSAIVMIIIGIFGCFFGLARPISPLSQPAKPIPAATEPPAANLRKLRRFRSFILTSLLL